MNMKELTTWVEANPGKATLIGAGIVIFLIWIFGGFSSSKSSDNGQSSLAAAYYAAEAQQAVVGGQIQQATIGAAAATATAKIQADAATTINAQNTTAATTISTTNTAAALSANNTNTAAAVQMNQDLIHGTEAMGFINNVIPLEQLLTGGRDTNYTIGDLIPGLPNGTLQVWGGGGFTPQSLAQAGYTTTQINNIIQNAWSGQGGPFQPIGH